MTNPIILCKPNDKKTQYGNVTDFSAIEPPIYMAILANYYKADILIDAEAENLTEKETLEKILALNPSEVIVLATGTHPSSYIQQKSVMERLVKALEFFKIKVEGLNKLPVSPVKWGNPRWDLLPMDKYRAHNWHSWSNDCIRQPYGAIYTSIGCPYHCKFCCIKSFYGVTFEQRLFEDLAKDFDILASLGIKNIKIMDELFIFNPKRVHSICDYIISKGYDFNIWAYARIDIMDKQLLDKMYKAGIKWLAYGIESGNDEIRQNVLKGNFTKDRIKNVIQMTKDSGINCLGNYMFGFWEDTKDTMQETLDLAKQLNCEYANFYCVVAYPDTPLHEEMKNKGVKLPTELSQYSQMSPDFLPLRTETLSEEEVLKFRDNAFNEYYNSIYYIKMMKTKFNQKVMDDIKNMTSIKLERHG